MARDFTDRLADPRIAKLPRWADELITDLARALGQARDELDAQDRAPTRVAYNPNAGLTGEEARPLYLPESKPVRFSLDGRDAAETNSYVDVTLDRSGRTVTVRGGRPIRIEPNVSNTVTVGEAE